MAADAKTLKDLENNILKLLSEATLEEILDEDTLIEVLEKSKETSPKNAKNGQTAMATFTVKRRAKRALREPCEQKTMEDY